MTTDRRILFVPLAVLALAGAPLNAAVAQPSTADPRIVEDLRVLVPQRGRAAVPGCFVEGVGASVRISGSVATTTLEITVKNPTRSRSEARLVLPVPGGASIHAFGIDGIGEGPTAELLPRDKAAERYRDIVRRMVDPGLLEFVGTDLIQSSVFPVEAGGERVVTVAYEHAMPTHAGRAEYVLPRSSTAGSGVGWTVTVEIEGSGGLGPVFSPSHPVVTRPLGRDRLRVTVPSLDEPGPFRLYAVTGPSGGGATVLTHADGPGSGYFLFVGDAPEPAEPEPSPREVTLVIDRSGSMSGEKIRQAKESARQIVSGLRPGERFNIIDYADDVASFAGAPVIKSDETMAEALAYIDAIQPRGWTNLHGALAEALKAPLAEGHLGMVLFLTDGLANRGLTGETEIRGSAKELNTAGRRVFTFGVGYDVNAPLLDAVAADTRAESTFVLPGEDVEIKVGQVFDKLDGPVILAPVFTTIGPDGVPVDQAVNPTVFAVHPESLGDVFRGSRVMIVGRYENTGPLTLRVAGEAGGPAIEAALDPDAGGRNAFVPRLWAQRRIDALLAMIRADTADGSEPDTELVDEVIRLSLEYGVMTEYTAFLAAEDVDLADASDASGGGSSPFARARDEILTLSRERSGQSGVSQTVNRGDVAARSIVAAPAEGERVELLNLKSNVWYGAEMELQTVRTVQREGVSTLYRKTGRWVEAALGEDADAAPESTVEFGSEAYWALVDDLAEQGRQWMLANRGEVYLLNHGRRVLVKNPS